MGTGSGITEESWAVTEFAEADLGDARRTQRAIRLATVLAQQPMASLPEACGSGAEVKAAYRFFGTLPVREFELRLIPAFLLSRDP